MIMKLGSLFQIPSTKPVWNAPWRRNHVISEIMHPRQKVTMERYEEVMIALLESVMKNRPGGEITMTSYPACKKISLSRKTCIADKKLLLITLKKSWSRFQNPSWKSVCMQRSLADDWRWRHVWLAIKHRYLGNQASQIKRYYGSLSWNLGRLVIFIKKNSKY